MSPSAQHPVCLFCGTSRPVDEARCPQCGKPWIDVRIGSAGERTVPVAASPAPVDAAATVNAADAAGDTAASGTSRIRLRWLIPALLLVVALSALSVFLLLRPGSGRDGGSGTTAPTTAVVPDPPPTTTPAPSTTSTESPTTSTVPPTTIPSPTDLPPVGEPVPLPALTLRAGGLGPVDFGTPASDAVGRLTASIGTPVETGTAGENLGLCPGDVGRFVRWDGLTVIVSGTLADGVFAGYRYDRTPSPEFDLATPSGLHLGDTVARLNEIYATYRIDYLSAEGVDVFHLSGNNGLLLQGPLSSPEPTGVVEGIHSPDPCPERS